MISGVRENDLSKFSIKQYNDEKFLIYEYLIDFKGRSVEDINSIV